METPVAVVRQYNAQLGIPIEESPMHYCQLAILIVVFQIAQVGVATGQSFTLDSNSLTGTAQAEAQDDNYDWDPQSDWEGFDWPLLGEGSRDTTITVLATSNAGKGSGSAFQNTTVSLDLSGPIVLTLDAGFNSNCSSTGTGTAYGNTSLIQEFSFTLTEPYTYTLDATLVTPSGNGSISLTRLSDYSDVFEINSTQSLEGVLSPGSYIFQGVSGSGSSCWDKARSEDKRLPATHEHEFTLQPGGMIFLVQDGLGNPVSGLDLDLYRPTGILPDPAQELLGTLTTDAAGEVAVPDSLSTGDAFRLVRRMNSQPAAKHPIIQPIKYYLDLDNARIDSLGVYSYQVLTAGQNVVVMDHTTVIHNLVVSVEWDASLAYLDSTVSAFRSMTNYLYDVFDGQLRLGEVQIYDDALHWDVADIRVHASNMEWPRATPLGVDTAAGQVFVPRRWFGSSDLTRNGTTLDVEAPTDYRTRAHELGHYLFNLRDEYVYSPSNSPRCGTVAIYGFMDSQYVGADPMRSEMSSFTPYYGDSECRNTEQWVTHNSACWPVFDGRFQGSYGSPPLVHVKISSPDERALPAGMTHLPGPNDNLAALDLNVGSLLTAPVTHAAPVGSPRQVEVRAFLGSGPSANTTIRLIKTGPRIVNQGKTSDSGTLTALGVESGDVFLAWGWVRTSAKSPGRVWISGQNIAGTAGPDTLEIAEVSGDYPLIPRIDLSTAGLDVSLDLATPFTALPTLDVRTPAGTTAGLGFSLGSGTYTAAFTGNPGSSGDLTFKALDDQGASFFVVNEYAATDLTGAGAEATIDGPRGGLKLTLDPSGLNTVLAAVSEYPPLRDGLEPTALQAGPVHVLAEEPAGAFPAGAALALNYPNSDLADAPDPVAAAASLKVHRWDASTREWKLVGGQSLPAIELVSANIAAPGVYALFTTSGLSGVDPRVQTPGLRSELLGNHPNPFNPRTTISFELARAGQVRLSIYDVAGRLVRVLLDEQRRAGGHEVDWNGRDDLGHRVSSGLYYSRLEGPLVDMVGKMLMLK